MAYGASLTQPIRFQPKNSVTELVQKNFKQDKKIDTTIGISYGITSGNSSSSGMMDRPVLKQKSLIEKINTASPFGIFSENSSSSGMMDSPILKLERLIKTFKYLKYGWNGDSAKPIPESVIRNSHKILLAIKSDLPEVYPTGRESIQFEYDKDDESLEIEIFSDRFEIALFKQTNLLEEQSFSLHDSNKINEYIAKLYEF